MSLVITQLQPFLLLFFTQVATIAGIFLSYRRQRYLFVYQQREIKRVDRLASQLRDFYGPIHILLRKANSSYGVFVDLLTSNKTDDAFRIVRDILIPTNDRVTEIILTHSDLLRSDDEIERYVPLLLHADMLKLRFIEGSVSTTLPQVAFPEQVSNHVANLYQRALGDLKEMGASI